MGLCLFSTKHFLYMTALIHPVLLFTYKGLLVSEYIQRHYQLNIKFGAPSAKMNYKKNILCSKGSMVMESHRKTSEREKCRYVKLLEKQFFSDDLH